MSLFRRDRRPPPPAPSWLKIGVLIFIGVSFLSYMRNPGPVNESLKTQPLFDYDSYRGQIIPSFGNLTISDVKPGKAEAAMCGQEATIRYRETPADAPEDTKSALTKLTFRIGGPDAPQALSEAVRGMREGGERRAVVPVQHTQSKEKSLTYTITLDSLSPALDAPKGIDLRSMDTRFGSGQEASCGDSVTVHVAAWKADGSPLLDTRETGPVTLTLGTAPLPPGLTEGILGMRVGGARTIIVPDRLQKPFSGKDSTVQGLEILSKLPSLGGLVVADIELLPAPAPSPSTTETPQ